MDRDAFRQAALQAVERICSHFDELEGQDVVPRVKPGDVTKRLPSSPPQEGEDMADILADFDDVIIPSLTYWQHPNFFAYFAASTNYESILGEMLATAFSNPGFNWLCSPACAELENTVTDWVAKLLGLDEQWQHTSGVGGGIIVGSASESCLTICVAARERYLRLYPGTPLSDLVVVATTQTHSLAAKAALILGLDFFAIETSREHDWALTGEQLESALLQLEAQGKRPFVLVATLGTTSTGAIDRLDEVTAVTSRWPQLWLHVDAAYGGIFLGLPECREESRLATINERLDGSSPVRDRLRGGEVHSFCTNLNKGGLVALDASCLWARDRSLLSDALDVTPPFLRTPQATAGLVTDNRNMSLSLTRRFRSLKFWFVLRSFGVEGYRAHLRKLAALAVTCEGEVRARLDGVEIFAPRRFSLVVVRMIALDEAGAGRRRDVLDYENALNARLIALANADHSLMLTPTTVGPYHCVRIAIGSAHTEARHIHELVEKLAAMTAAARNDVDAQVAATDAPLVQASHL